MTDWDNCQDKPAPDTDWPTYQGPPGTDWPGYQGPPDTEWGGENSESYVVTTRLYPVEVYESMQVDDTHVEQVLLWSLDHVEMDSSAAVESITVFQTLFDSSHNQFIDDFMDVARAVESITVLQTLFEEAHDQFVDDFMEVSAVVVSISVTQTLFPVSHDQPSDDFMFPSGEVESVTVFES